MSEEQCSTRRQLFVENEGFGPFFLQQTTPTASCGRLIALDGFTRLVRVRPLEKILHPSNAHLVVVARGRSATATAKQTSRLLFEN